MLFARRHEHGEQIGRDLRDQERYRDALPMWFNAKPDQPEERAVRRSDPHLRFGHGLAVRAFDIEFQPGQSLGVRVGQVKLLPAPCFRVIECDLPCVGGSRHVVL